MNFRYETHDNVEWTYRVYANGDERLWNKRALRPKLKREDPLRRKPTRRGPHDWRLDIIGDPLTDADYPRVSPDEAFDRAEAWKLLGRPTNRPEQPEPV